ncbi:hypothetical protein JHK84_049738 [Glycine max]|nr:hypothetical protein JHK86_049701 [Glycine max]KAG4935531.1 hypothetical protein JHK85_050450 [Glycine max]KAG5094150.1 hypothetical protein JHK84_049738 [Glycine max]
MIAWTKQLNAAFGASFLWLICLIYFTQGFRSFVWTSISYQLKDNLKLSPSASQFVFSVAFFPWSIKPLYGILSDCIPIKGRKRIPYLVIATVLSLVPWLILGLISTLRDSTWHLMVLLTAQNLGSAMADVVVDAMIAEASVIKYLPCWSGHHLQEISSRYLGLLWLWEEYVGLLSCCFVEEKSENTKAEPEDSIVRDSHMNGSTLDEDSPLSKKSHSSTRRRKKGKKNAKGRAVNSSKSKIYKKGDSLALKWFHSLKEAIYDLCRAFRQPMIWRCAHIGLAFLNLLQIAVVSRKNIAFGISDKIMVLFGSALADGINQFKFMPFLILSGQLCPPGIEGTLFALFMSINNLGSTLGSFVGAGLASILNIDSGSFDNLLLGIIVHALCNFIPIAFLFLIPKEATGSST